MKQLSALFRVKRRICVEALILLLLIVNCSYYWHCFVDDSYISMRYARNLADGFGLTFNPGEEKVEGYTNFLWVILTAAFIKMGFDALIAVRVLGIGATLITAVVLLLVARRMASLSLWAVFLCMLPWVLHSTTGYWATSGMEAPLMGLFWLLLFISLRFEWRNPEAFPWSSLIAVGACLLRPDGLILLLVASFCRIVRRVQCRRMINRMDLVFAATVAVVLGGYSVFKMVYFGSLLPNTYYAKIVGRAAAWHRPLGRHYLLCFLRFHPFDVLLPLAGTVLILRAKRYSYLFALALLFTIVFVAWFSNGDWMPTFRFMLPFLVISVPIYFAASQAGATTGRSKALSAVFSICLLTSPIHAFRLETVLPFRPDDCVKKSQYLRRMNPLSSIGEGFPAPFVWQSMWLAQNCLPDAVIAIPDIGFIGYSTDLEVMDFVGLTDADMTRIVAGPNRNRDFLEYFHLRRPDIVFLHRAKLSYTPEDDDHTASEYWGRLLMGDHEFLANYECVETRNVGSIRGYLHIYRRKDYVGPPSKPNWAFLDQVLKRARLVPNVQCEYAYLLQQSGKSEEYHNHVNMLTKRFPSNAWALLLGARAARQRGELEKSLNLYWRTYRHAEGVTREKALREMEVVYRRAGKPAGKVGRLLEAMKASAQ